MRLKQFIFINCLIFCITVWCQPQKFQFVFNPYFANGISKKTGGREIIVIGNNQQAQNITYKLGSGIGVNLGFQRVLDSTNTMYWACIGGKLGKNQRIAELIQDTVQGNFNYVSLRNNLVQLSFGIGFSYVFLKHQHCLKFGPCIPLYVRSLETKAWNSGSNYGLENRQIAHRFSIGAVVENESTLINKNGIICCLNLGLQLLNAQRKTKVLTNYTDNLGRSVNEVYPNIADYKLYYLNQKEMNNSQNINDKVANPRGFDTNKISESFAYREFLSAYTLGFSLKYNF